MLPKVSIIIPVYNGANYMREAINSALAQTYKNIEIIVINDGSRDNGKTEAIALSYGDKIRYFSKENGGCASALNVGIKNMQGEYFSWLSHDDVYLPNKVEHQINILNKLNDKDTILYCGYELINEKSKTLYFVRPNERYSEEKLNIPLYPLLRGLIHGCTLLISRKYFDEVGLFDEALKHTQDYDLWFKLFRIAPIHFDSEVLIKSREHPEQSTRIVPNQIEECEVLWSGFLNKLTEEEMIKMEGSAYTFLSHTVSFLKQRPYIKARKLALSMAEKELVKLKISVIMPVYNSINFAIKAIESVLAQTHKSFELIVVDDGSTEDITKLYEICQTDPRIIYIHQENKGPAAARNWGIKRATGEYITFLDANDLFKPDKLTKQVRFTAENAFNFSHTSYEQINLKNKSVKHITSGTLFGKIFPQVIYYCPVATSTVMVKASLLKSNLFPENVMIGEDHCLWITLASRNLLGGINTALSKVRVDTSLERHVILKKESLRIINVAAFVANNQYLSEFSPVLIYSLSKAIKHLKYLKKKNIIGEVSIVGDYDPLMLKTENLPPIIAATIYSLKKHGIRVTIIKIYRWIKKRLK